MNFRWGLYIIGACLLTINSGCQKDLVYDDTLVYGHAGTTIHPELWVYPANTKESVLYALDALGAEGVEIDIQMTKDSVLVLFHDPFLDGVSNLTGCIAHYNFSELTNLNLYQSKYELVTLEEIFALCFERNKKLYLDLKPFNHCIGADVNHQTFNNALNKLLVPYSSQQKTNIVVNTRNIELLDDLTDSSIIKSFETENIPLAIEKYQTGEIDEVGVKLVAMNETNASEMNAAGLNFTIFSLKSQKEIQRGLLFSPIRIVTDNIAYTQKLIH
jgi:glycerophosphoryl diester phosphodiesterase